MNRVLLSIGPFHIYWYAFLIVISVVIGIFLALKEANRLKISKSYILDLVFYLIIFSIIGARVYYVIFNLDIFMKDPLSIFKVWEGGLAIYGAIIASFLVILNVTHKRNQFFFETTDIFMPSLILGQAIGRWGNFINKEAFGKVVSLDFLNKLHLPDFIINGMYIEGQYHHPTFLYESIWCLLGFIILMLIRYLWKKRKRGDLTFVYFIWYGIGRVFIESLRTDSLYIGSFRVSQIVSIILIVIGIIGLVINRIKNKNQVVESGDDNSVRI